MNGQSKWNTFRLKGKSTTASPRLCECGYKRRIGGDGGKEASFFYDSKHSEWVCEGCGAILERN